MFLQSEEYEHMEEVAVYRKVNRYLTYLIGLTIGVFILGMLTYGQKFSFWDDAFSYLGQIHTGNGNSNIIAMLIFMLGMSVGSLLCFRISSVFAGKFNYHLFRACGAGYVLMMVPCDLCNPVHVAGGAFVVGSLWFFSVMQLNELSHLISRSRVCLYHIILHGTVLPYAILYPIGLPVRQAAQKLAVFGLILILKITVFEHLHVAERKPAHSG